MNECTICMENINCNKKKLKCGHIFHTKCIEIWKLSNNTCPICRQEIKEDKYCPGCYFCLISFIFALCYQTWLFIWLGYKDIEAFINLLLLNTLIIGCISDYWIGDEKCYYCIMSDVIYGWVILFWGLINMI